MSTQPTKKLPIHKLLQKTTKLQNQGDLQPILKQIQANIIKPHGNEHALFAFITLDIFDYSKAIEWLKKEAEKLTHEDISKKKKGDVICLYLSYEGFEFIRKFKRRPLLIRDNQAHSFRKGLVENGNFDHTHLDPNWKNASANPVHLLYLFTSDNEEKIKDLKNDWQRTYPRGIKHIFFEEGMFKDFVDSKGVVDKNSKAEWFGFKDGISNPRFFPGSRNLTSSISQNITQTSPSKIKPAKLQTALLPDKNGAKPFTCGSFLVFLKLEQHEKNFEDAVKRIARKQKNVTVKPHDLVKVNQMVDYLDKHPVTPEIPNDIDNKNKFKSNLAAIKTWLESNNPKDLDSGNTKDPFPLVKFNFIFQKMLLNQGKPRTPGRGRKPVSMGKEERAKMKIAKRLLGKKRLTAQAKDFAAAQLIGRHKDGTPLTSSKRPNAKVDIHNFGYDKDKDGLKCPFHAHVRKSNPRTDNYENYRIVRRSMLYEEGDKKGLLFMSFQRDLEWQFEDLTQRMIYNVDPFNKEAGKDALLGPEFNYSRFQFPKEWGKNKKIQASLHKRLVTFKGGLYFFAPSIPFFQNLEY